MVTASFEARYCLHRASVAAAAVMFELLLYKFLAPECFFVRDVPTAVLSLRLLLYARRQPSAVAMLS